MPPVNNTGRVRVLNVIAADGSPVGGVASWALRLPGVMDEVAPRYDVNTLWVALDPDAWDAAEWTPPLDERSRVCRMNPAADHVARLEQLVSAMRAFDPAIVIANHTDLVFMAAGIMRGYGARMISAARSDEPYVRDLFAHYPVFDGAMAVSEACLHWLRPIAGARPVAMTPSGAPVAASPRVVPADGPLRISFVGRLAQTQKRVLDLLPLVDELASRRVNFELDIVGDGPEGPSLRAGMMARAWLDGRVRMHGAKDPAWVQRLWPTMDVAVLTSEYEGTSIAMQEAMAHGVVPVVTDVTSVRAWVTPGETGLIAPVGDVHGLAAHVCRLSTNRGDLASLGRAAWMRVRNALSPHHTSAAYARLFDEVMARPIDLTPNDCSVRPMSLGAWRTPWSESGSEADRFALNALACCGYRRIALGQPEYGCDAVCVRSTDAPPTQADVDSWRGRGLGVVISPTLRVDTAVPAVRRAVMRLAREGCRRIALYGAGAHTRKVASVAHMGLPLVGVIDDGAPADGTWEGLPIVRSSAAMSAIEPDGVVLSSDTIEARLWHASAPLRAMGVRVIGAYSDYEREQAEATIA